MSFRTRFLLGVLGLLLITSAVIVLTFAFQPTLVDRLSLPLDPALFTPPLAAP